LTLPAGLRDWRAPRVAREAEGSVYRGKRPSASLATLVARQSKSNHFKVGEINDQNFAAMTENRP